MRLPALFRVRRPVWRGRSSPKEIVGDGAVLAGAVDLLPAARDFALKRRDARGEFVERETFEILPHQLGERIGRVFRENLVEVHVPIVDRCASDVNKTGRRGRDPAGEQLTDACDTDDDAGDRP